MAERYGNQRRVFKETQPSVYDKATRTAYVDFQADTRTVTDRNGGESTKEGWSGFVVQLDGLVDYGHIKSLLVESAYPQKDEHAFAINTLSALVKERGGETLTEDEEEAITEFKTFNEWRGLCAVAAKAIMEAYK